MTEANVIAMGNAATHNARKAQMLEHFARKLDKVLADGASELSVAFVIWGKKPDAISTLVNWDAAEGAGIPVRMYLTDGAALMLREAADMRGEPA